MPGFDACFKAPKSVSLLWAFGDRVAVGSSTLDRVMEAAHDEAVHEAMSYLEGAAARGHRGRDGLVQVATAGSSRRRSASGPRVRTTPTCTPASSSRTCARAATAAGARWTPG